MNKNEILNDINEHMNNISQSKKEYVLKSISEILDLAKSPCDDSDLKLIQQTIKEIKESHDTFYPYRTHKKICIFGSARTPESNPNYDIAFQLAEKLTQKEYYIITGAGPGIMEAGNKGALKDMSFGLNIELPYEQSANYYILHSDKLISYKYFFTRKLYFIKESHASIILPGGFGTHDESFEVLTLIQTGRCAPRPLIFITHDANNYWETWREYIKIQLLDRGYISEQDLNLISITNSIDDCIQEIDDFYYCYDSLRYINHQTVMRITKNVSPAILKKLKSEFPNLILGDTLQVKKASEIPEDAHVHQDKKRLVFQFDKVNYGGLTLLIKRLNTLVKNETLLH